jgi:hypothetical protein
MDMKEFWTFSLAVLLAMVVYGIIQPIFAKITL